MIDTVHLVTTTAQLVIYPVTEAEIAQVREACASLTCDTPDGYEAVRVAIGNLRTTRTTIEKRRVELKADALRFGRLVDTEAKRFTDLLLAIENPLKAKKAVIDDEAERVKREKEAAALKIVQDEIDRHNAEKAATEKAIREAEEARLAAERAKVETEWKALAAEQARLEAARKAEEDRAAAARKIEQDRMDAERAKIDAERRVVDAERQKAERAEFERQARIQAENAAVQKAHDDRLEKVRRDAELAALVPDLEKVTAFVAQIRALQAPKLKSRKLTDMVAATSTALACAADTLASCASAAKGLRNG